MQSSVVVDGARREVSCKKSGCFETNPMKLHLLHLQWTLYYS